MQNLVTVVAVERERERAAFYTNRQEENKARVGENSTLKSIYLKEKESIMLEN